MKKTSSPIIALLVSLLIMLVSGQGLASGFVLCVGEDGHSAFEQAWAGNCAPSRPSCTAGEPCSWSSSTHDHCGACKDYSTTSETLHGRSRGAQDISASLFLPVVSAVPSPTFTIVLRDQTANLSPLPPPRPYTALIALRTVVLLN